MPMPPFPQPTQGPQSQQMPMDQGAGSSVGMGGGGMGGGMGGGGFAGGGGAGPEQAVALFEQGFSAQAYAVLSAKHPDLMDSVVTFKVLDTDPESGCGVGAFIVKKGARIIYIPTVMALNALKPIELLYDKQLNIFLPLTKGWIDELDKVSLDEMGKGIKTPESLYTDVDIRAITVPPTANRYSYASLASDYIDNIEKTAQTVERKLLPFLTNAPNSVKTAFVNVLEKHPSLLKYAAQVYGVQALTSALQLRNEKTAAKQLFGGALWIADKDNTPTEFRRVFGDQAAEAYSGMKLKGYAAKDTRKGLNKAVQEQPYSRYVEPTSSGVYTLYKTDGAEMDALVIHEPIDIFAEAPRYARRAEVPGKFPESGRVYPEGRPSENEGRRHRTTDRFLAVLSDGTWVHTNHLAGRDNVADGIDGSTLHTRLFKNINGKPKNGLGFFVRARGTSFDGTCPMYIKSVTTGADGARRIIASKHSSGDYGDKTLVTDSRTHTGTIQAPRKSPLVMLPEDYIWVPLKGESTYEGRRKEEFFRSVFDLSSLVTNALKSVGVRRGSLKNAAHGQYSIDGRGAMSKVAALRELAVRYYIPVEDAETLLEKVSSETPHVHFFAATLTKMAEAQLLLEKHAGDDGDKSKKKEKKGPPAQEEAPPEDPSMGMDPSMMAPPAPPPPNPADLAAMEMQQQIEHEMQKLQEKAQMLAALTQRTQEIAGGAPVMPTVQTQAMGAPPPSMNMATGMPTPGMGPGMGQEGPPPGPGGMDPAMMGQQGMGMDPGMPGMGAPPMDPSMGGMPPGMDPSMQQGMGMDPSMGGMQQMPPPQAMMPESGPSSMGLEQQINPQFLQDAAQLQSHDIFDAAAVASLAQSPAVKEMVGQYVPNLEKALDNLGRIELTLWMQEGDLKEEIGDEAYSQLEDRLRTTFSNLGDLVLSLNQNAHALQSRGERALA